MGKPIDKEKRKNAAREVILRAVKDGHKLRGLNGLKRLLAEESDRMDYDGYFSVLDTEDLGDLLCEALNSMRTSSPAPESPLPPAPMAPQGGAALGLSHVGPHTTIGPGNSLTPAPSQQEGQSEGLKDISQTCVGVEDETDEERRTEEAPEFDENASSFLVVLFNPIDAGFDIAVAVRCKQRKSFISHKIVQRMKLFRRVNRGSIRLSWQERSPQNGAANKVENSRFHLIADEKYRYEIAIGEGCDDPDTEEDEPPGTDEDVERLPGDEGEETSSSIDAEMPLESRRSRAASLAGDRIAIQRVPGHLPPHYSKNLAKLFIDVQEELDMRQAWDAYQASSSRAIPAQPVRANGAGQHATSRKAASST